MALFLSGSLKQSGNGVVRNSKLNGFRTTKNPPPNAPECTVFDFEGEPVRHITLNDISRQKSMYEV